MANGLLASIVLLCFMLSSCSAYANYTRDQILNYYQSNVQPKLPKAALMLIGNERINAYAGGMVYGIVTSNGNLASFDTSAVPNPTIVVTISDSALDKLYERQEGLLAALSSGGITIHTNNFFSSLKVAAIKSIYAASGADSRFFGPGASWPAPAGTNSMLVQRAWIPG